MSAVSTDNKINQNENQSVKEKDKSKEEEIRALNIGYKKLIEQQKAVAIELKRVEEDKREHERVLDVLRKMEDDRKCFRMVGTTLVQHRISTVIPILNSTLSKLNGLADSLKENLVEKEKEIQEYIEKHNIQFVTAKELIL